MITLKRSSHAQFDNVSRILLLLSVVMFSYSAYIYQGSRLLYGLLVAVIAGYWVYVEWQKKQSGIDLYYRRAMIVASAGWMIAEDRSAWVAVLFLAVAALEKFVKFSDEIGVAEKGITFNKFPKRTVQWSQLSNLVLKDGLLTIDYLDNKLFQKEVEDAVDPSMETELNNYCLQRISLAGVLEKAPASN